VATGDGKTKTVSCPTCDSPVAWVTEQRWRPFCSERCKLIDLGTWFDESNRIPSDPEAQNLQDQED
jgi:endogenous inhibitor of DNA gyrase (YacG/DUF329 family)